MSNEQKAREIVEQYKTRYNDTRDLLWEDLEEIALQAMEWKEQQMIDKLQKWLAESPPMKNKTVNAFYVNNLLRTMRR